MVNKLPLLQHHTHFAVKHVQMCNYKDHMMFFYIRGLLRGSISRLQKRLIWWLYVTSHDHMKNIRDIWTDVCVLSAALTSDISHSSCDVLRNISFISVILMNKTLEPVIMSIMTLIWDLQVWRCEKLVELLYSNKWPHCEMLDFTRKK